jgi:hypothetical protein
MKGIIKGRMKGKKVDGVEGTDFITQGPLKTVILVKSNTLGSICAFQM